MHVRVIEIIALEPPGFGEKLLPFGHWVDGGLEGIDGNLLLELLSIFWLDDGEFGFATNQDLFAFCGRNGVINVFENRLVLTFLEVIKHEAAFLLPGTRARQPAKNQLFLQGEDISVITSLGRKSWFF